MLKYIHRLGVFMNIGILATGGIAHKMAKTLSEMNGVTKYAVASRTEERANAFKEEMGFEKAYGSYEELCKDQKVELVYIASPHSEHFENMKLCIKYHKPILCEKAFCINSKQAEEVFKLAEEEKVFVAEAMWTRYMPSRRIIDEILNSNIVGDIHLVVANLGYSIKSHPRLVDPKLGGGSLLDVGVYPITFTQMIYKETPEKVDAHCTYTETGVDETDSYTLTYKNNKQAFLYASMDGISDRTGYIYGSKGYIKVININDPSRIEVYLDQSETPAKVYPVPEQISGYEYQVEECVDAINKGKLECASMPQKESLRMMNIYDEIRSKLNVIYPGEE